MDKEDVVIGIVVAIVLGFFGLFIWASIGMSNMRMYAPCEEMKSWTVQNIPSRCFGELNIEARIY